MRFPSRQPTVADQPGVSGTVRLDRRTGSLVRRLRPGDIAVLDHLDLDRANAQALVDRGVVAVVNASPFISGRFPNLGPELLARAGVLMVDEVGSGVFSSLHDGSTARVVEGAILVGDHQVAVGRALDADAVAARMEQARDGLSAQLQSFTHNTAELLRREQELLLHGQGVPALRTVVEGRPVVVVVAGYDYREDLRRIKRFIREQRPVLVGVDSGADALLAGGHRPDVVVVGEQGLAHAGPDGEPGAVSDKALRSCRDVVLHADASGHAAGSERLDRLGLRPAVLAASGSSEDAALLMADLREASLIIAVGTHATLEELLDRQRAGLAATFLTRLRVGPKLVDARGVAALYAGRVRLWHLVLVLLAGLVALGAAIAATPVGQQWWSATADALTDLPAWIQGLFS